MTGLLPPCETPLVGRDALAESGCTPLASRREARRLSRCETILDVATCSFMEFGYAGTTMTAIAAKLGGSKGTLWSHYPSKDVLFAAVLDRATKSFRAQLSYILEAGDLLADGDMERVLRQFCTSFMERLSSPDGLSLYRLVIGESGRLPEVGQIFNQRAMQVTRKLLAGFLDKAMTTGRLRQSDALPAAQLLMQMCMAGSHQRLLLGLDAEPDPDEMSRDIDRALAVFLRAFAV